MLHRRNIFFLLDQHQLERRISGKWKDRIRKEEELLDLNQGKVASYTDRAVDLES
jgi:hypothetical protein